MERLTGRKENGHAYIIGCPSFEIPKIIVLIIQRVVDKCAAIEDILGDDYDLSRLRELVEADRDGRCVVLPCEVGETVYMPFCDDIVEKRIGQFHINGYTNPKIWADIDCDWATTQRVRWDLSFGKTVFLTREAAEAALKGEKDG